MFICSKHLTVASRRNRSLSSFHNFKSQTHQTLHFLLEKCSSMKELKQIHAQIVLHGFTNEILTVGKLVSFCAVSDTGNLGYAQLVFNQIPRPNKFMYNSLIRGYSNSTNPIESVFLYRRMIGSGLSPNEFTLPFVLKACACESLYWVSVVVHGQAIKFGIGSQVCVQNGLINGYVSGGFVQCARKMFDDMSERTLVSWNSMIGGYSKVGYCKEAFLLFKVMRELKVEPDEFTLANLLSVCSQMCDIDLGRYVHLFIEVTGIEIDFIVTNALIDMYSKCGHLQSAQRVFERMPNRNVVSWTSMVCAYAKHGLFELAREMFEQMPVKNVVSWNSLISYYVQGGRCKEALHLFHEMNNLGDVPDETTLLFVLSACSQVGDLIIGEKIHDYVRSNYCVPSATLYNSLVDMYAKCGSLKKAMDVFDEMPNKNLVSWNVLIGALALHGYGLEAIKLFEKMQAVGMQPDEITFTGLLSACNHGGLVDMGKYYFNTMSSVYGIVHQIQHYACMIDILGRGGHLKQAVRLIREMPMRPDIVIWGALLGACRTHGNVEIGKQILKQLLELEPYCPGLYVLLSNLFSEAQRWKDVKNIRKLMNDSGILKCHAISFIEIEGCVYEFMVDDKQHEVSGSINSMIGHLTDHLKSIGHICNIFTAHSDIQEI